MPSPPKRRRSRSGRRSRTTLRQTLASVTRQLKLLNPYYEYRILMDQIQQIQESISNLMTAELRRNRLAGVDTFIYMNSVLPPIEAQLPPKDVAHAKEVLKEFQLAEQDLLLYLQLPKYSPPRPPPYKSKSKEKKKSSRSPQSSLNKKPLPSTKYKTKLKRRTSKIYPM